MPKIADLVQYFSPIKAQLICGDTGDGGLVPAGSLVMTLLAAAPAGYLLCNGAAVSRTTYSVLFGLVGTTYGVGDGTTTFNLPDLRQKFPLGKSAAGTGSTLGGTGGTIDHTHSAPAHYHAMGTGADLAIGSSGTHIHLLNVSNTFGLGSSKAAPYNALAQAETNEEQGTVSGGGAHTHAAGSISGRVGLVTGGVDGNAAMTSGSGNPPFMAVNFLVKY